MNRPSVYCLALLALPMFGCATIGVGKPEGMSDLGAEIILGARPSTPKDACWATDQTPAVIETTTDQIADDASTNQDAGYHIETRQDIVQPREQIWFRTPCNETLPPDVITTLQRALAARGLFTAPLSGTLDQATRAAIRAYQAPRGLNSDRLSLVAAQELGVVAADFGQAPKS